MLRVTGLCVGNSPGPVNSPHKGPVTRKLFPFDDVIMSTINNAYHMGNYVPKAGIKGRDQYLRPAVSVGFNYLSLSLIPVSGGCFINVSRALQNILSNFVYCRNRTSYANFKLTLCMCAQSHALCTRTQFQLEILTINVISGIVYFREIVLESSRKVSETTPDTRVLFSLVCTLRWSACFVCVLRCSTQASRRLLSNPKMVKTLRVYIRGQTHGTVWLCRFVIDKG